MKLSIDSSVQDIFDQFNQTYPFLKLEFYTGEHRDHLGSPGKDQLSHSTKLSDINPDLGGNIDFTLDDHMAVAEFENIMYDKFKLNIQVFRKSSGIWLQTTSTDHWSLEKQNGKGERSTLDYENDPVNITDFDLE